MSSAKKLLEFNFFASQFAARAPKPLAVPTEQLATLEKIIEMHDEGPAPPNRENLREVYYQFIRTPARKFFSEFNSLRQTRQLVWALTYTEDDLPRIVDTSKLQNALQLIEKNFRSTMLPGIFNALLQAWDTPNTASLRGFLKKHLTGYTGSRKSILKLKTNMAWYCEADSPTNLAMSLIRSSNKLSEVWTFLELPDSMHRYAYFGEVAAAYTTLSNQMSRKHVEDVVAFVKKHNNDETSRIVLSKLIEKLGGDAAESLRQPVQSYVLQDWQDPRIAGADVRWRDVSDKARQIFTQWITKEDLRFFFDVVAKACNDPKFAYRKAFWMAYFERITFCRPVLRGDAEYLFRNDPQAMRYYRDRRPAELKGGNSNQHAFIIQMTEFTFVEFSTAGACYVYRNANLPFELGDAEYRMDELRSKQEAIHRVIHHKSEDYYWQSDFESWLEAAIGIEILRSYRLDGNPNSHGINSSRTSRIERKSDFHIISCPNWSCQQKLRVPLKESQVRVRCPTCRFSFEL